MMLKIITFLAVQGVGAFVRPSLPLVAGNRLSKNHLEAGAQSPTVARGDQVNSPRSVARLQRPGRLPVWPAWNGVFFIVLDILKQRELAAKLEDWLGGRVCPMQLEADADPFILLVHHRHSFQKFDPFRAAFRALIAEGFPSHPHRGFETVTYVLPGKRGLVHRDSLGVKMRYSDGQAQWMTAGRGMLHEEMWETDMNEDDGDDDDDDDQASLKAQGLLGTSEAELYQLWLNLPPESKMCEPKIQLVTPFAVAAPPLVPTDVSPVKIVELSEVTVGAPNGGDASGSGGGETQPTTNVRVLSGHDPVHGVVSKTSTASPVTIVHSTLEAGATWSLQLPAAFTALIYVRKGRVEVVGDTAVSTDASATSPTVVAVHELAYLAKGGDGVVLRNVGSGAGEEADVMVFAGLPLNAPVASSGTMVMNSNAQVEQAFEDYQRGDFGVPWDHKIPDGTWRAQVESWKRSRKGP